MTEGETKSNGQQEQQPDNKELHQKIVRQVEYYFGDYNLPRDKFLQEQIKLDDGWVPLETMMKFKRLAGLSSDVAVICAALKQAEQCLMEVNEAGDKLRRIPTQPLPEYNDEVKEETLKRTVYCKGFAKDGSVTLDALLEFFKKYGPYDTVLMRHFFNKEDGGRQGFKGSVLVVFNTEETAKAFMELDFVQYNKVNLLRKWHADYLEEKKKEVEERRARKEARKQQQQQQQEQDNQKEEEEVEAAKGTFLHVSGLTEGCQVIREDLKAALGDLGAEVAWIDFSKGCTEGYIRFKEEEFNKQAMEKLEGKMQVKDMEAKLRLVEGEEEEEQLKKMREARSRARTTTGGKKRKFGGGGGGRGGGGGYGRGGRGGYKKKRS